MFKKKIRRKLNAHVNIIQPFIQWAIFSLGVVAGAIMSIPEPLNLIPLVIGVFLFSMFGQCGIRYINDFGDQDVDSLQEDDIFSYTRMIVKGEILPYEALGVGLIIHVSGIILSYFLINWFFALMFGVMVVLSFMYSIYPRLKKLPFTPNVMIGIGYIFLPMLAGYSIYTYLSIPPLDVWVIALLCAIFAFGGSIGKDFIDRQRDGQSGIRTLPVVLGERLAARVESALLLIPYLLIGLFISSGFYPPIMVWSFLALIPVCIMVYKLITLNFAREKGMQWGIILTWITELAFAITYRLSVM